MPGLISCYLALAVEIFFPGTFRGRIVIDPGVTDGAQRGSRHANGPVRPCILANRAGLLFEVFYPIRIAVLHNPVVQPADNRP